MEIQPIIPADHWLYAERRSAEENDHPYVAAMFSLGRFVLVATIEGAAAALALLMIAFVEAGDA